MKSKINHETRKHHLYHHLQGLHEAAHPEHHEGGLRGVALCGTKLSEDKVQIRTGTSSNHGLPYNM